MVKYQQFYMNQLNNDHLLLIMTIYYLLYTSNCIGIFYRSCEFISITTQSTDETTGSEKLRKSFKVTQLVSGRIRRQIQVSLTPNLIPYTFKKNYFFMTAG